MNDKTDDISNNVLYTKLLEVIRSEAVQTKEDIKNEIKFENQKTLHKLDKQTKQITELEEKCNKLQFRCINLERMVRKNNIVIFGLVKTDPNISLIDFTISFFTINLEVRVEPIEINNIYAINNTTGTPIKVEFVSYLTKSKILANAKKLKNKKIFIAQDLCLEDREDLKILQKHLKLARSDNYSARIKGKNLIVNNETYSVHQLKHMNLPDENCVEVATKSNSAPPTPHSIQDQADTFVYPKECHNQTGRDIYAETSSNNKNSQNSEVSRKDETCTGSDKSIEPVVNRKKNYLKGSSACTPLGSSKVNQTGTTRTTRLQSANKY